MQKYFAMKWRILHLIPEQMWCDLLHYLNAKGLPELARVIRPREIARSRARGRRLTSGQPKPFLLRLRLRTHVAFGAKEVLGAAPKLARTGARQGARCGGVLLSVRANDVRRLQQRWISRKTRGENLDAFAPRLNCKMGISLRI